MAFGFQNCCDSNEYFYVNNIPNTVSEYEVYYIDTLEDLDFCASYVELPELFYQPKTYNLRGMTAQTNCTSCITINPCPDIIDDNIDELFTYVTTTSNECSVITETFFEVSCGSSTVPTITSPNGGIVRLNITGGVPPYLVYSGTSSTLLSTLNSPGTSNVLTNKPGGTYSFTVQDFILNSQSISCTLPAAPTTLSVSCNVTNVTLYFGNTNGVINQPTVNGGTSPYTYWSGSTQITSFPINNRPAGTYPIIVKDSGTGSNFQQVTTNCVIIDSVPQVNYPSNLCMSFEFCGTGFLINFVSAGTSNGKAYYTPDTAGRNSLGINNGMQLKWDTAQNKWITNSLLKVNTISLAGLCNPTSTNVQFSGPTTEQPNGSWQAVSNTFYANDGAGNTVINVTAGACTSSPLNVTANITSSSCDVSGIVAFTSSNGTAPYIVYVGGTNYGNNLTITGLFAGSYSYSITDSLNRTTTGNFTINTTPNPTINLSVSATFNTSNDYWQDLSNPTRTKLIGRRYDVSITTTGLDSGESIQGYFVITYKQLSLYKTTGIISPPDYPYDSTIYQPNVTWQLITDSGSGSGYNWQKNGITISNQYSDETVQFQLANRRCSTTPGLCIITQVPSTIMTSSANNACPTSANQAGEAALRYTVGTQSNPITIDSNTTITGKFPTSFRWRPNASGVGGGTFALQPSCPRAYAEDWEIYFVQVGNLPQCKSLTFNDVTYSVSNPDSTRYRRSFAVVDNQAGTQNTVAIIYGNGTPWSSIVPDSQQRVLSYYN